MFLHLPLFFVCVYFFFFFPPVQDSDSLFYALARCFHRLDEYIIDMAMYYRSSVCSAMAAHNATKDRAERFEMENQISLEEYLTKMSGSQLAEERAPGDALILQYVPLIKSRTVFV